MKVWRAKLILFGVLSTFFWVSGSAITNGFFPGPPAPWVQFNSERGPDPMVPVR